MLLVGVPNQEGGLWLNLGPLLYHWADAHTYLDSDEVSIEVSLKDVEGIAAKLGFRMLRKEQVQASFNDNPRSGFSILLIIWLAPQTSILRAGRLLIVSWTLV